MKMHKIGKYEFPGDLYYDETHNWARVEADGLVTQGMSNFGQALAGKIMYVEPAVPGRQVKQGAPLLVVESGKWVGRVNATVSGEIVAFNEDLEWEPETVNGEPYGGGWMVRLRPTDLESDLARLMRPGDERFRQLVEEGRQRYGL